MLSCSKTALLSKAIVTCPDRFKFISSAHLSAVYGSSISQLLGDKAEADFSGVWAVGLGVDQANQWVDVVRGAVQAAILLTLLDRFEMLSGRQWLEMHLDQFSVQTVMLHTSAVGFFSRLRHLMQHTARIEAT